ncbi:MAG: ABC transporter substrate-binding protein [Cycloclasticus sp.]|nr:ABC transporter substrate-binding protein [Cycloclasticus sp.]MBQ0789071.1 ABC transporter substrate-binding protein [Cycloclasticus sp.]
MKKINGFCSLGLTLLLLIFHSNIFAGELNAPQQVIQETSDLLYDIVKKDKDKLSNREYIFNLVDDVIEPRVDLDKVSKLVLGKYWRTASEQQKTQFQKEFKGLLVNTYATAFTEFQDWTVHFLPMSLNPDDSRVIVKTEIIQASRPPVSVDYRMTLDNDGQWKAYDVIIEGISMVTNYKGSFATSIKNSGGLENVIKALAEKNEQSKTSSLTTEDVQISS